MEKNLKLIFGEGCVRSMQCIVDFGYRLITCCMTEENHRKQGFDLDGHRTYRMHTDF